MEGARKGLRKTNVVEDQGSKRNSPTKDFKPKQKEITRRAKKASLVYVEMSDEDDTMETIHEEEGNEEEGENQRRKAGAKGKTANGRTKKATIASDGDYDFGIGEDDDTDYEEAIPRKGSKKLFTDKASKPSKTNPKKYNSTTTAHVPRKRGPKRPTQGQKLIDEMFKTNSVDDVFYVVQLYNHHLTRNPLRKK